MPVVRESRDPRPRYDPLVSAPEQYLASLEEPRRSDMTRLHELIRETLPELEPEVASGGIGYGRFHYRYASGREGDAHHIGLANRKHGIALHVLCESEEGGYLVERYVDRLPRADVGKSCVRFRRLDYVDVEVLRELLAEAGRLKPIGAI
jgi:uncharacterized protein DUF1801